jgi:hypothetical protein
VSLLKTLKKGIKQLDPMSSKSALGGVTRAAISQVPGGSAALGALSVAKNVTRKPTARGGVPVTPSSSTTATADAVASQATDTTPSSSSALFARFANLVSKPAVILGALGVVGVLVLTLVVGRKKV